MRLVSLCLGVLVSLSIASPAVFAQNAGADSQKTSEQKTDDSDFFSPSLSTPSQGRSQSLLPEHPSRWGSIYAIQKDIAGGTTVAELTDQDDYRTVRPVTTGFGPSDGDWFMFMADVNSDGTLDLVGVNRSLRDSSGAVSTYIRAVSGPNWRTRIIDAVVGLGPTDARWDFAMRDWDRDGKPDLFCICRNEGELTTIHVFSAASSFNRNIGSFVVAIHPTNPLWSFGVGNYDGDGRPDLYAICRDQTTPDGGRATTLHVYTGGSSFKTRITSVVTGLHPVDEGWSLTTADADGDGFDDVVAVNRYSGYIVFLLKTSAYHQRVAFGTGLGRVIGTGKNYQFSGGSGSY